MRRILGALTVAVALVLLADVWTAAQQTGIAGNMAVKTDANGYLAVSAAQIAEPVNSATIFGNTTVKTDANGYLLVGLDPASDPTFDNTTVDTLTVNESVTLGASAYMDTFVPLGGVTSAFPALKRSSDALQFRNGDDSAYIDVTGRVFVATALFEGTEQGADPSAPAEGGFKLYAKDNGSGKTTLCARFATGAVQCFATEP